MPDTDRSAPKQQDTQEDAPEAAEQNADGGAQEQGDDQEKVHIDVDADGDYGQDEQNYVDRDNLDFDVDKGMYNGTAVDGTSSIPGPHERQDDVAPEEEDDGGDGDGESDGEG